MGNVPWHSRRALAMHNAKGGEGTVGMPWAPCIGPRNCRRVGDRNPTPPIAAMYALDVLVGLVVHNGFLKLRTCVKGCIDHVPPLWGSEVRQPHQVKTSYAQWSNKGECGLCDFVVCVHSRWGRRSYTSFLAKSDSEEVGEGCGPLKSTPSLSHPHPPSLSVGAAAQSPTRAGAGGGEAE